MVNFIKLLPYPTLVAVSFYLIKRYFAAGSCKCNIDLTGKVVIVTGGLTGIGKEIAAILSKKGAKVVIASRKQNTDTNCYFDIWMYKSNIEFYYLDLRSFNSIREFSKLLHNRFDSIYALVNNAGVFCDPLYLTENGFDTTFQTNYLGPFLLTQLLLDLIRASPNGGRIVNVTCEAHRLVKELHPKYIDDLGSYCHNSFYAYAHSKVCLQLFTHKLSQSLADCGVTVNDANPGNVHTSLLKYLNNKLLYKFLAPLHWLLKKSPEKGAQTPLHLILSPDLRDVTGKYFSDCKEQKSSSLSRNAKLAEILWIQSLAWVNS